MIKREVESLFERVMSDLGHAGWSLNWTTDDYSWNAKKRIDLVWRERGTEMWLLHEIAHIDARPDENANYHSPDFFAHLEQLARRYLGTGLDAYQLWLRDGYRTGNFGPAPDQ